MTPGSSTSVTTIRTGILTVPPSCVIETPNR